MVIFGDLFKNRSSKISANYFHHFLSLLSVNEISKLENTERSQILRWNWGLTRLAVAVLGMIVAGVGRIFEGSFFDIFYHF